MTACPLERWVEQLESDMAAAEQLAKRRAPVRCLLALALVKPTSMLE